MELILSNYGYFLGEQLPYYALGTGFLLVALGYLSAPLWLWTLTLATALVGFGAPVVVLGAFGAWAVVWNVPPIRALLVSSIVLKTMKALRIIPVISDTEKAALEAGVVWADKELFSGRPNFKMLLNEPYPHLTQEEQEYLNGPVEKLCAMIDEWQVWQDKKLPDEAWAYLKEAKFFGMIIPKEYGGLGFSAMAHSEVIHKLSSRSIPAAITAMVPNSLGPAELLTHFGTEEQKKHYLPRLANGTDIPCFALTEPRAGSDAGSIQAEGVLFRDKDGKLKIKLNWNKRWITLAAVSTVIGMAFRLRDPENFLGKGEYLGITCALVPANTKGVVLGNRHDPLGVPFYNCPTQGHDVVVDADESVIGGLKNAGLGWNMLMESLGAGRGISLPSQAVGSAKLATRVTSTHATIRKQFGLAIGKFEGVEEALARMGGFTYLLEAMRRYTLGALDQGIKPSVITAIAKYHASEMARKVSTDAMDVMGGAGISRGPRNLIANYYVAAPISITVEGANILTRTLMIFGQGALRAHPFAYAEVKAVENNDVKAFDHAFWGHIGHIIKNAIRSVVLSLSRGYLAGSPVGGPVRRYYQKLAWTSASFAIMSDLAMGILGGKLKQKEKITGRYADILSWMYINTSVLRRYEAEGRPASDLPFVHYCMQYGFNEIQKAFDGIFANLRAPGLSWFFGGVLGAWSRMNSLGTDINDDLSHKVAASLLEESDFRDRLTDGIFIPKNPEDQLARLERAFKVVKRSEVAETKIRKAIRKKLLPKKRIYLVIDEAKEKNIITQEDYENLKASSEARWDAIQVDDFTPEEYWGKKSKPSAGKKSKDLRAVASG